MQNLRNTRIWNLPYNMECFVAAPAPLAFPLDRAEVKPDSVFSIRTE